MGYCLRPRVMLIAFVGLILIALGDILPASAQNTNMTNVFFGVKVNAGTVTHTTNGREHVLTVSEDFQVPDTPDPHWQVVDSKGTVYRLQRLDVKDDKVNRSIVLPASVTSVSKVQIWCAWAEALLGEASFSTPQMTH